MRATGPHGPQPGVPGAWGLRRVTTLIQQAQRYVAIAIGFSIPISTALDNILSALLLLLWLGGGGYAQTIRTTGDNPVALAALALFALCVIGLAWSVGSPADGMLFVRKYSNLLLIPILVTVFTEEEDRKRALLAFSAALVITLLASYGLALGWLPTGGV